MSITFKSFEPADSQAVVAMMRDFYAIDNYPMDEAVAAGLFAEFVANEALGRGWVLLNEGQPAGYVILTFVFSFEYKGRIAFLDELFISPETRGLGFGKETLDFIHEQARQLGIKIIYLEVEGHNETAKNLYLSKNYSIHNRGLMKLVVK